MHWNMYGTGVLPVREQLPGQKAEREEPSSRASTIMTIGGPLRFQSMYLSHGWATGPHPPPPAIRLPLPFAARRARHSGDLRSPRPSGERRPSTTELSAAASGPAGLQLDTVDPAAFARRSPSRGRAVGPRHAPQPSCTCGPQPPRCCSPPLPCAAPRTLLSRLCFVCFHLRRRSGFAPAYPPLPLSPPSWGHPRETPPCTTAADSRGVALPARPRP